VRAAEEQLVAANARIGEAKALMYPQIGLSANGGFASRELSDLFASGSQTWSVAPFVSLPLFTGGRLSGNVAATEARQRQALERYLQTLEQAFREVADALVQNVKVHEVYEQVRELESVLSDQAELSRERYRGGVTSYLEVLDSERDHFSAQLDLVRTVRDELFATVQLYRALGGGWQDAETLAAQGGGAEEAPASEPATDAQEGA
jgi:multidrug efflux system outer membrane protein